MKISDIENTPKSVWRPVLDALGIERFGTDPCTNEWATVPAQYQYGLPEFDGLLEPWDGVVWCNPPYSRPRPWIERCALHNDTAVALITPDTSTAMWHDTIFPTAALIVWVRGRIKFDAPHAPERKSLAKRPSAIVLWAPGGLHTIDTLPLNELGEVMPL